MNTNWRFKLIRISLILIKFKSNLYYFIHLIIIIILIMILIYLISLFPLKQMFYLLKYIFHLLFNLILFMYLKIIFRNIPYSLLAMNLITKFNWYKIKNEVNTNT